MQSKSASGGTVATHLIVGDQISVNLVASNPGGQRLSAAGLFNHMGEAIDAQGNAMPNSPGLDVTLLGGAAKPEFPMAKYQELVDQGSSEAAEDVQTAYELQVQSWEQEGNQSLEDSIATAALDWADRVYNVKTTDHDGPKIEPEQIVVKSVIRATPEQAGLFIVQLTPSWG